METTGVIGVNYIGIIGYILGFYRNNYYNGLI